MASLPEATGCIAECPFPQQGHQGSVDEARWDCPTAADTLFRICLSFKHHGENWTELNGEAQ